MKQIQLKLIDGKLVETVVPFDLFQSDEEKRIEEIERIRSEYLDYLDRTDKKVLPYYEPTPDENLTEIIALRNERRRWLRENKNA